MPRTSPDDLASIAFEKIVQQQRKTKDTPQKNAVNAVSEILATSAFSNVLDIIASEVGVEASELLDETKFADLGIDSLLSISIGSKLREELGKELPATLFMDYCSVKVLRMYFAELSADTSATVTPQEDSSDTSSICSFSSHETPIESPMSGFIQDSTETGLKSMETFRKIIASEVGVPVEEVDEETPLSDIGVDSLLSLSILNTVQIQSGRILPSSFLTENPTFGAIRQVLTGSVQTSLPQVCKAIQKASTAASAPTPTSILLQGVPSLKPCLFLLPDGSGSASSYIGLPSLNQPGAVYGLNSPFLTTPKSFTVSLQEVSSFYITEIQRVQPHGPYNLGGWSIGGSYAFEVASQLIRLHGEAVNSLVMIDTPCPKVLPPLPMETVDLLEEIGAFDGLKQSRGKQTTQIAGGKSALRDGVREHFAGSVNALRQYQPSVIPHSLAPKSVRILWASHGVWETVGEDVRRRFEACAGSRNSASDWMFNSRAEYGASGWDILLPGANITSDLVVGDHFSIMRKPGVLELGGKMAIPVSY